MKLIHAMILNQNAASAYAARVVSEMIKSGCDAPTMRRHEIPTSVFYCVLGGSHHLKGREPSEMACDMIRTYRPDFLYNAKADGTEERSSVKRLVETSFCHTHGEYDGSICPECKSPLDLELKI